MTYSKIQKHHETIVFVKQLVSETTRKPPATAIPIGLVNLIAFWTSGSEKTLPHHSD